MNVLFVQQDGTYTCTLPCFLVTFEPTDQFLTNYCRREAVTDTAPFSCCSFLASGLSNKALVLLTTKGTRAEWAPHSVDTSECVKSSPGSSAGDCTWWGDASHCFPGDAGLSHDFWPGQPSWQAVMSQELPCVQQQLQLCASCSPQRFSFLLSCG